ncbi:MAG: FAD-dependent oxidoreductase, partial [Candidatus Limnocylindrales bacterium]
MDTFDFVIIGAGPAGEAAAHKARELGATVAIVDRRWFGGSCPFIGCLPSKALLYSAARHAANHAAYDWSRASAHRDFMVNRPARRGPPPRLEPRRLAREGRRRRGPRHGPDRGPRSDRRRPRRPGPPAGRPGCDRG